MLTASATMEGPSSRIPKVVLLSVKLAVAQNSAERQKFNEVNTGQFLKNCCHYVFTKLIIMQKVQICMTEHVLSLIKLQGLKLSLSFSLSLTLRCGISCLNIPTLTDSKQEWVTSNNVSGSSLPKSICRTTTCCSSA